jgi:thioredoxin 1
MQKITADNFDRVIKGIKTPYLIKFFSKTCAPCKVIAPVIEQLEKERKELKVLSIDVDEAYEIAGHFGVRSVPTVMICQKREILYQFTGVTPKGDIEFVLDNLDDPYFKEHGEFRVEKKIDYVLWGAIGVALLLLISLFIYVIKFY